MRASLGYVLIAAAVFLGWETIKAPLLTRAPQQAVQIGASSPDALGRMAESQFEARRFEDANVLAQESLRQAPFNVRALRILGLVRAREAARQSEADDLLTLAGNWSLRDDPAHAWLIERRLRQGDFSSALAHADTLARRREELHPRVFNLFTQAATLDRRALPPLTALFARNPPWRGEYLQSLRESPQGDAVMFHMASSLAGKPGAFSRSELEVLYKHWLGEGRVKAIQQIRHRTAPNEANALANGDFEIEYAEQALPFGWELGSGPEFSSQIVPDDLDPDHDALRVQVGGDRVNTALDQFLLLPPGSYRLKGVYRVEYGEIAGRADWILRCAESVTPLEVTMSRELSNQTKWTAFSATVQIPATGCTGQHLVLLIQGAEHSSDLAFWIDKVQFSTVAGR